MRSFHYNSLIAFRQSNLGNLYHSFIKRNELTTNEKMTDGHTTTTEIREKEEAPSSFPLSTISTMASLADVEGEVGLSNTKLSAASVPPTPPILQRTQTNTSFLSRLSGRLRRSFHVPTSKRIRFVKPVSDDGVGSEETFTNFANIKIVDYDESCDSIKLIRQILHRNRPDEVKKLLRKTNWPVGHRVRANLWQEICKLNNPDFNAYKGSYESEGWDEKIEKARFLQSLDVVHECYELNANGLEALHRLIRALDATVPTLNYAPLLQPILALFLHYMNEGDAYACAHWILKNHSMYMKNSALSNKAGTYTLLALVKVYKTAVYKFLRNWIGSSDENILAKALQCWPRWIFCALPFEHLVHVIDCYLYEGKKVLLRVAITLLSTCHKNIKIPGDLEGKTCQERADLFVEMIFRSIKNGNISLTSLLEAAMRIRNFRGAKIARFQDRYEKIILKLEGPDLPTVDLPAMYIKPFASNIVSSEVAFQLMCHLPEKYQLKTPMLIYHLWDDGTSFYRLWTKIDDAESTLLIIKTDKSEILGAFCDEPWGNRTKTREHGSGKYFGGGLSFVWNLDENNQVNKYDWKENQAEYFMAAPYDREPTVLMIGGNAIYIVDELIKGLSMPGNTFENPRLVKDGAFKIDDMEVLNDYEVFPYQFFFSSESNF